MKIIRYINMKGPNGIETVDEFFYNTREEKKEAQRCLKEYRLCDRYNTYYLSRKACKAWIYK